MHFIYIKEATIIKIDRMCYGLYNVDLDKLIVVGLNLDKPGVKSKHLKYNL